MGLSLAVDVSQVTAGQLTVQVGPPSIGMGGANPVSLPPLNPLEYAFIWIQENKSEWLFSIVPGLMYGKRMQLSDRFYTSLNVGLVINANGEGVGVGNAFGYSSGRFLGIFSFNAELRQTIAISRFRLISPYAIRIGLTTSFS